MGQFDNSNSGYIKLFLEKHGYEVFVDVHNNRPGNFIDRIFQEIQMSQVFLLLLTPNALDNCVNANDFVRLEIETAIQYQVTIIPILYEGFAFPKDMPQSISNVALWHGINYHQNSEVGFEHELLSFLENMEGTKKYSTASAAPLVYSDPAVGKDDAYGGNITGAREGRYGVPAALGASGYSWNTRRDPGQAKKMKLPDLLSFDSIVIQCHDAPDADALASGFALKRWFLSRGRDVPFVYGGMETKMKPNLLIMKELLGINIMHTDGFPEPDLLITVDCRYGEKNVTRFPAKNVCVIDHHPVESREGLPELCEISESLGSCSTLLYRMLLAEGFDISGDKNLQTALYYGLYMDTCSFQELWHPEDKDMFDDVVPDKDIFGVLINTNITSTDLSAAVAAFAGHRIDTEYRFGVAEADTEDGNILGVVSDTLLGLDTVDVCTAIADLGDAVRFFVRSCVEDVRADELAKFFSRSSGGAMKMAGGVLRKSDASGDISNCKEYFIRKYREYRDGTDIILSGKKIDISGFSRFRKLPVTVGVVDISKLFTSRSCLMVRTMEGDIEIMSDSDSFLIIGAGNEIYPIKADIFQKKYRRTGKKYVFPDGYIPVIRNYVTGEAVCLEGITESCTSLLRPFIFAKRLERRTHVFTYWNKRGYIYGNPGDWIAVHMGMEENAYIIPDDIFRKTYDHETKYI